MLTLAIGGVAKYVTRSWANSTGEPAVAIESSGNGDCRFDGTFNNNGTLVCGSNDDRASPRPAAPSVRTITLPDPGDHWLVPAPAAEDAPPTSPDCTPAETAARVEYFKSSGGVHIGRQNLQVEIVNDTDETLIIESLDIASLRRGTRAGGEDLLACHDIGGDPGSEYVSLDLSGRPPKFVFHDRTYQPTTPFRFSPERHRPVIIYIEVWAGTTPSHVDREYVQWTAELRYSVGGAPRSAIIDDQGRPFEMVTSLQSG